MEFENVLVDTDGPVATITLNRPEKLNALSDALRADLHDALVALSPVTGFGSSASRGLAGLSAQAMTSAPGQAATTPRATPGTGRRTATL
jgi:hypothetical protein